MCADRPIRLHVVPGQVHRRWCNTCRTGSALEVGVYILGADGHPELVGTFTGCVTCDPDMFDPPDET